MNRARGRPTAGGAAREQRAAAARRALDALAPLGPVESRAMFGGHGVYLEGAMLALVAGGEVYLKVDDVNRERFVAAGLPPFVHVARGREITMSFHRAPEPLDDWGALAPFAESALLAARRALAARAARRRAGSAGHHRDPRAGPGASAG